MDLEVLHLKFSYIDILWKQVLGNIVVSYLFIYLLYSFSLQISKHKHQISKQYLNIKIHLLLV